MEAQILPSPEEVCLMAARLLVLLIAARPEAVVGRPTGATPAPQYAELVRLYRWGELYFGGVTTFNLEEYVGLGAAHPRSYTRYMDEHLFEHVNIDPSRRHIPDGTAEDIPAACERYEAKIRAAGGIDLMLLG